MNDLKDHWTDMAREAGEIIESSDSVDILDLCAVVWAQQRIAALEAELADAQAAIRQLDEDNCEAGRELAEERARLAGVLQVMKVVRNETTDLNIVIKVDNKIQFLTLVLQAAIDAARRRPK